MYRISLKAGFEASHGDGDALKNGKRVLNQEMVFVVAHVLEFDEIVVVLLVVPEREILGVGGGDGNLL